MTAIIGQAKSALNRNLSVTRSRLDRLTNEHVRTTAQIQAFIDRAEIAERSSRDIARELQKARTEIARLRAVVESLTGNPS